MNGKNDDIAHPDIVSKPLQTSDYWPNSIIRHRQGTVMKPDATRDLRELAATGRSDTRAVSLVIIESAASTMVSL
jgi:hypothetical protein